MIAAIARRTMDTALNAGPRSAFEGFVGSFPHEVPWVPAPKFSTTGDEIDVEEGEAEEEATATGRAAEVLEGA